MVNKLISTLSNYVHLITFLSSAWYFNFYSLIYCIPESSCAGRSLRDMCTTGFLYDKGGCSHNCKYACD